GGLVLAGHDVADRGAVVGQHHLQVARPHDLAAAAAGQFRIQRGAARLVHEADPGVAVAVQVLVPPAVQGQQHRVQVLALGRQHIFVARRPLRIGARLQHPVGDQRLEPGRQHVARHAQPLLPLLEPADAVEGVADDQQRPRIADHLEGGGDRATLARIVGGASHDSKVTPRKAFDKWVAIRNGLSQSLFATNKPPRRPFLHPSTSGRRPPGFRPLLWCAIAPAMSPTLTESLRVNAGPDGLRAHLAPELSNMPEGAAGGAPFGGLMAALSVRAARAGLDVAAPLKSLTVQFVAGARFEPLDCRPELLRGGRQVSYASIRLGQGGRLATQALATFGQDVEAVSLEALRPVGPPPVDSLPTTTLDPGFAPRFTRYVEHRFDGGPRLFGQNAGGEPVVRCWMRTADRAPLDEDRLCFL